MTEAAPRRRSALSLARPSSANCMNISRDAVILLPAAASRARRRPARAWLSCCGTTQRREEIPRQQVFEQCAFECSSIVERPRLLQCRARADVGRDGSPAPSFRTSSSSRDRTPRLRCDRAKWRTAPRIGPSAGADERRVVHHRTRFAKVVHPGRRSGILGIGTARLIRHWPAIFGRFRQRVDDGGNMSRLSAVRLRRAESGPFPDELVRRQTPADPTNAKAAAPSYADSRRYSAWYVRCAFSAASARSSRCRSPARWSSGTLVPICERTRASSRSSEACESCRSPTG